MAILKQRRKLSRSWPLMVLVIATFLQTFAAAETANSATLLEQLNNSLKQLADRVSPAVVEIKVSSYGTNDDGEQDSDNGGDVVRQHLTGAGVILSKDGYIITNAHLINGATRVQVILNLPRTPNMPIRTYMGEAGGTFEAKIVGVDQDSDLAVLKIDTDKLLTLKFANYETLRQGQMVVAFGSPLGMMNVATIGIVSSVARQIDPDSNVVYVQTDAAVNPGNSGGALVDIDGDLVGINTAILNGQRLGLAIPSDTVQFVYEQIRQNGRVQRGEIGLGVQTITPKMATGLTLSRDSGVIVSDVRPGLPSDKAGIHPQDIVASVDNQTVVSVAQFVTLISQKKPGDGVSLRLLRGSGVVTLKIPVIAKSEDPDPLQEAFDAERHLLKILNIVAVDLDNRVAESIPGIRQRSGILVTGRCANREGIETSLKVGDVIHAINGKSVSSVAEIRGVLAKVPFGSAVVLRVEREKRFLYLVSEAE
jgi:serine protease Do